VYKLLIADDEALEREALHYFVSQSKLEISSIIESSNGTETVKKVMLEKPDIILMDINMPGMNGLEALEKIKLSNHHCKVIFSTAFNYFEYAVKALQLGAIDFLVKPVSKERLIAVLNKGIDQLDYEVEKRTQSQRVTNVMSIMGKHIAEELISGNITDEVMYYIETIGIDTVCDGNCFCVKVLREYTKVQKTEVLNLIKKEFKLMGFDVIWDWNNKGFIFIVFNGKNMEQDVIAIMHEILISILNKLNIEHTMGIGLPFEDISQIEQSYNYARGILGDIDLKTSQGNGNDTPNNIKKICRFIEENYYKKINLDDIAKEVGYSKYHIGRLFKEHMGTTIIDYLIQMKIEKAKDLLKQETYSIKQISNMVGYTDSNYFTCQFKKVEGVSPVKYRYTNK